MKSTNKPKEHTETWCLDTHRGLPQLEENKFIWAHSKDWGGLLCMLKHIS